MQGSKWKLVRDRIPELLCARGECCETEALSVEEYKSALLLKLEEEASEVAHSDSSDLLHELADVYEVLEAICDAFSISRSALAQEQTRIRQERGGFAARRRVLIMT
jgi:predicted house-cleaning noncanonical NTP pyrophosphatase (MazG superfamily)